MPVTDELRSTAAGVAAVPVGFLELSENVAALGQVLGSVAGRCGYLHMEFSGAGAFRLPSAGRTVASLWGPSFTADDDSGPPYRILTRGSKQGDWAINGLLRWLGVTTHGHSDEFREAGLGAY